VKLRHFVVVGCLALSSIPSHPARATVVPGPEHAEIISFRAWFVKIAADGLTPREVSEVGPRAEGSLQRIRLAQSKKGFESGSGQAKFVVEIEPLVRESETARAAVYEAFQRRLDRTKLPMYEVDGALVLSTYIGSEYRDREGNVRVITKDELGAIEKLGQGLVAALPHDAYRHNMLARVSDELPSILDDATQRAPVAAVLQRLAPGK